MEEIIQIYYYKKKWRVKKYGSNKMLPYSEYDTQAEAVVFARGYVTDHKDIKNVYLYNENCMVEKIII